MPEFAPGFGATFSARRYPASQQVEVTARGTIVVRFRVGVTPDLEGWLLSWGEHVVVRSPKSLGRSLERIHLAALRRREWEAPR